MTCQRLPIRSWDIVQDEVGGCSFVQCWGSSMGRVAEVILLHHCAAVCVYIVYILYTVYSTGGVSEFASLADSLLFYTLKNPTDYCSSKAGGGVLWLQCHVEGCEWKHLSLASGALSLHLSEGRSESNKHKYTLSNLVYKVKKKAPDLRSAVGSMCLMTVSG